VSGQQLAAARRLSLPSTCFVGGHLAELTIPAAVVGAARRFGDGPAPAEPGGRAPVIASYFIRLRQSHGHSSPRAWRPETARRSGPRTRTTGCSPTDSPAQTGSPVCVMQRKLMLPKRRAPVLPQNITQPNDSQPTACSPGSCVSWSAYPCRIPRNPRPPPARRTGSSAGRNCWTGQAHPARRGGEGPLLARADPSGRPPRSGPRPARSRSRRRLSSSRPHVHLGTAAALGLGGRLAAPGSRVKSAQPSSPGGTSARPATAHHPKLEQVIHATGQRRGCLPTALLRRCRDRRHQAPCCSAGAH